VQRTVGILRDLQAFFWLRAFSTSQALSTPAHTQVTQTLTRTSQAGTEPTSSVPVLFSRELLSPYCISATLTYHIRVGRVVCADDGGDGMGVRDRLPLWGGSF
jgi:hypothetical protein